MAHHDHDHVHGPDCDHDHEPAEDAELEDDEDEGRDPEREARRRLALAQIRQYPDPVLRMTAREVEAFDHDLLRLVERMAGLMDDARGIGLAATQVGVLRRLFVFRRGEEDELTAVANPEIVARSDEVETSNEGCLSLQGVSVPVERPAAVTLVGRDAFGEELRLELEGLDARCVQHEIDHLDGVLIINRTTDEARRGALASLRPRPELDVV